MELTYDTFFIGGEYVAPAGPSRFDVVSPVTEEVIGSTPEGTAADIDRAVAAAREAFDRGPWPRMTIGERQAVLARIGDYYDARTTETGHLQTTEMGAPVMLSTTVLSSTVHWHYYSEMDFADEEVREGMQGPVIVRREPVGVVAAIVPWNAPVALTQSKVAPALLAGCTLVVKPSPQTAADAYLLAEAAREAGLPPGVINIVAADREVSELLVRHPGVDKVSFTGSAAAGRRIMSLCGQQIKRVTLELGGKSASLVTDDADLDVAVRTTVAASIQNNSGQACLGLTRMLVPRGRQDEIVDRLIDDITRVKTGDPFDMATSVGPMASRVQRERVEGYIHLGQQEGARIAIGGGRPADLDRGWYVEPTLFAGADNSMRVAREEIFGPVLTIIPYDNLDEAVDIANDSDYGLSGTVWSADVDLALAVARRIRTGTVSVNGYRFEHTSPFGGYKCSGLGREWGPEGLQAYLEYKTIPMPA